MSFYNLNVLKSRNRAPVVRQQDEGARFRARSLEAVRRVVGSRNGEIAEHRITRHRSESATSEPFTLKNQEPPISLELCSGEWVTESLRTTTTPTTLKLYNVDGKKCCNSYTQVIEAPKADSVSVEEKWNRFDQRLSQLEESVNRCYQIISQFDEKLDILILNQPVRASGGPKRPTEV